MEERKNKLKERVLMFHPAVAPYRVDFLNALNTYFDLKLYISLKNVPDQKFNQNELVAELEGDVKYLTIGFNLTSKVIRFGIIRIIKKTLPKIIICSEFSQITIVTVLFSRIIKSNVRIYTICDDSIDLSIKRKGLRKFVRNFLSSYLDGIIFPSENVGNWYNKNVNYKTKTLVLPITHSNSIFRKKLTCAISISLQEISMYSLNRKKVFLFVGRLVKIKNVEILLKAFNKARRKNDVLAIIGEGPELVNLKNTARYLGLKESCIFLGRLEGIRLNSWYNIAGCFILPSYVERYGAVVNEALLAGCRVLCSELAGASELITESNGRLFDPYNELQLCNYIKHESKCLKPISLPITVKNDLMPFDLPEKLELLFSRL